MTREQMAATLLSMIDEDWGDVTLPPERERLVQDVAAYLRQSCATCQHSDDHDMVMGWTFCDAPKHDPRFPFGRKPMPLDERCRGWQAKEDA